MPALERIEDSADRRMELAAQRTYASWVQLGLVALAALLDIRFGKSGTN